MNLSAKGRQTTPATSQRMPSLKRKEGNPYQWEKAQHMNPETQKENRTCWILSKKTQQQNRTGTGRTGPHQVNQNTSKGNQMSPIDEIMQLSEPPR